MGQNKVAYRTFKGTPTEYRLVHQWVQYHLGKPKLCNRCGSTNSNRYEWSNISGEYRRDLVDYERLCKPCHAKTDIPIKSLYKEFCIRRHRMTLDNIYLLHTKTGICIRCKACRKEDRLKYKRSETL